MIALPASTPHVFRNAGEGTLRLLGIHGSPTRIVHRLEEQSP
jgi:mannose-6-phosphate isomerase-like protein (cupin superfamily)